MHFRGLVYAVANRASLARVPAAQRWADLLINAALLLVGCYYLNYLRKAFSNWMAWAVELNLLLYLLAIVCNRGSRATLPGFQASGSDK